MAVEYSYAPLQTVAEGKNILFFDEDIACRKGFVTHRNGSGIFRLKAANNACKTIYRVTFNANIAVTTGGTVGPISVALQEDGETIGSAVAVVSPTAAEAFFNVSFSTFIIIPCGCCVTISVENTSEGTATDVTNAKIIIDRIERVA